MEEERKRNLRYKARGREKKKLMAKAWVAYGGLAGIYLSLLYILSLLLFPLHFNGGVLDENGGVKSWRNMWYQRAHGGEPAAKPLAHKKQRRKAWQRRRRLAAKRLAGGISEKARGAAAWRLQLRNNQP